MYPAKRAQTQNAGEVSWLQWFFPNPLNWWRIRFGCTSLGQCYWNKENWFAAQSTPDLTLLQLNIKEPVLCKQGYSTARNQITKLGLWPLDHSSSDVKCEQERPNITYALDYCWLSLRHFYMPECQSQKANILASTMPLIIEFFIKIKCQFGRFWEQTRIII